MAEVFALHLPQAPTTGAVGGARLWAGKTVTVIEPSGVVGFAPDSREKTGSELAGNVSLFILESWVIDKHVFANFTDNFKK